MITHLLNFVSGVGGTKFHSRYFANWERIDGSGQGTLGMNNTITKITL